MIDKIKEHLVGKGVEFYSYCENPIKEFVYLTPTERHYKDRDFKHYSKIIDVKTNSSKFFTHSLNIILENDNFFHSTPYTLNNVNFIKGTNGYFIGSCWNVLDGMLDMEGGHFIVYFKLNGEFKVSKIGDFEGLMTIGNIGDYSEFICINDLPEKAYTFFYLAVLCTLQEMCPKQDIFGDKLETPYYTKVGYYYTKFLKFNNGSFILDKENYKKYLEVLNSFLNPNEFIYY